MTARVLLAALLVGCGLTGPMAERPYGPSRLPVGPLALVAWLPAGFDEPRLGDADQRRLADLGLTHLEWLQRSGAGEATAEALAMAFCGREGLAMPVYYEAPGYTPYDKLRNWATRPEPDPGFDAAVRERILGLKARWGAAAGFGGYLVGHEDYRPGGYEALARTVAALRAEDPARPAFAVGALGSYPSPGRFLDALFADGGEANLFQHEHYVFAADVPPGGLRARARLDDLVAGYDRVAEGVRDRHGRWHAIVQVHGETRDGALQYRPPTAAEISVQAALAVSRGASGVVYFLYSSGREHVRNDRGDTIQVRDYDGLVDAEGVPSGRYHAVAAVNARLRALSAVLAPRYFLGGYEARRTPADAPVASRELDLDLAFFGDGVGATHVLAVSRRTDGARTVDLQAEGILRDVETGMMAVDRGAVDLSPGGFRLLAIARQ